MGEEILAIGHAQPDTDSIVSAIGYAKLKRELGKNVKAARCGELNPETRFVLERFSAEEPVRIDDATGRRIILLDHNEYSQAVDGLNDAEIVEILDHHRIGDVETSGPIYFRAEPVGSTSTIVVEEYRETGVPLDDRTAGLLLSGILSDTVILRSPTATERDERVIKELSDHLGLDYEEYGKKILKEKSKLGEKEAREIVLGDFKEYEFGDGVVGIGQVETVAPDEVLEREDELHDAMEEVVAERGYTFLTLLVTDLLNEDTEALFEGERVEDFEEALGTTVKEGKAFLPDVLSRKKQVVPPIEERLAE